MKIDSNVIVAGAAVLYLLNIGLGFVEILPDNAPVIGNLDEVLATYLMIKGFNIK